MRTVQEVATWALVHPRRDVWATQRRTRQENARSHDAWRRSTREEAQRRRRLYA